MYWKDSFPNYLQFQDKFTFDAKGWNQTIGNWFYYSLEMTSFVTSLKLPRSLDVEHSGFVEVCAYWRILTLEENYMGDWTLEAFDDRKVIVENETVSLVETWSHLYTYMIHKQWAFYKDKPYFTVTINRTYLFDSENMNNQIIFDVKNNGVHSNNQTWVAYETEGGTFGYVIVKAQPNNVTIQTNHPTESQINFYGLGDRDLGTHKKGEQEILELLVFANQYASSWQDIYGYLEKKGNSGYEVAS